MKTFAEYITEATKISLKRTTIIKSLNSLDKKVLNKSLTPKSLTTLLSRTLNTLLECDVTSATSPAVSLNTLNVTAFYDAMADEDEDEPEFEFILVFNPDDKIITLSRSYWKWFKDELADAILHEMMHKGQAESRSFIEGRKYLKGKNKDQTYYGNADEIEAYAMNASLELKRNLKGKAKAALSNPSSISNKVSPSLKRYMETFQSPEHSIMKKFLKKVYMFLSKK